jgi:hypothetical protein
MDLADKVAQRIKAMTPDQQTFIARLLDEIADAGDVTIEISAEEQAIVDRALAEVDAGDTATDAEVAAYRYRDRG